MSVAPQQSPVLVLRHDTLEELLVPASALRWFSYSLPEADREQQGIYGWTVRFGITRPSSERRDSDVPFLRISSDAREVVRVTAIRGTRDFRKPARAERGWGRAEAEAVKRAKVEQRRKAYNDALTLARQTLQEAGL